MNIHQSLLCVVLCGSENLLYVLLFVWRFLALCAFFLIRGNTEGTDSLQILCFLFVYICFV